jgi:hypothetical protein
MEHLRQMADKLITQVAEWANWGKSFSGWLGEIKFQQVQSIGIIVAIVFTGYQIYRLSRERLRSRYVDTDSRYREFIKESMDDECAPMAYDPSLVQHFLAMGGSKNELLLYDLLFSSWESAYLLYRKRERSQWGGWQDWITDFFKNNPRCSLAWDIAGRYFDKKFVRHVTSQCTSPGDHRGSRDFPETLAAWNRLPVSTNLDGLTVGGFQVMQYWEAPVMRAMVDAVAHRTKAILEVGYGLGISAELIQQKQVASHTILEPHPQIFERLTLWARRKSHVSAIQTSWEEWIRTAEDSRLDGILFDTYPLRKSMMHKNHFTFFPEAKRLLKPGGLFTYYSDEALYVCPEHQDVLLRHFQNFR